MARTQSALDEIVPPASVETEEFAPTDTVRRQPKREEKSKDEPDPPQDEQKLTTVGFFEQISRFSSADWESHIVYVYRLSPITDRLAGGTTKYLMKYGSRFDQDTVKADHGSGRYRLQLNRSGDKGQSKTIRTYELDIEDVNFPPKVPPGEWLDDPRNKRWAWAKKKEDAPTATNGDQWTPERITRMVKDLRPEVTQPQDQMSITKAVLDAVKETRAELGAANNPQSMITTLKELILIAKPADPPAPKPEAENPMYAALMRMVDAAEKRAEQAAKDAKEERERADKDRQRAHELEIQQRKQAHELELERLKQKAEQTSPVAMVKEVLNLQKEMGALGGNESRRPGWPGVIEDHAETLAGLAKYAVDKFAYARTQPAAPQGQQQPQRPQQPPAAQSTGQPQRPHPSVQTPPPQSQPAQAQPVPESQPMPETQQSPLDPDTEFLLSILQAQGRHLVEAFKNDPHSGPDIARTVSLFAGELVYERIARIGPEKIMAAIEILGEMKKDMLKAAGYTTDMPLSSVELIKEFISEFCDPPDEDDPDEDEDDEPDFPDPSRPIESSPTAAPSVSKKPIALKEMKS